MEHRVQIALGDDRVSVRHRVCWVTLFRGRLTRLTRFRAAVSHGSTLVFRTTLGDDRGAKAAADEGSRTVGIMIPCTSFRMKMYRVVKESRKK